MGDSEQIGRDAWDDQLDPVAITLQDVLDGKTEILLVIHEEGHGGWQFLDGHDTHGRAPVVVPKGELASLDPTIRLVTDLPVGWMARRAGNGAPWQRSMVTADLSS